MDSYQVLHSTGQTQGIETATGSRKASAVRRIALVAALAGFAVVAVAVQKNTASDQPAPSLAGATAMSIPGNRNAADVRLAPTASEYYFPAQYTNQARPPDGNVMTYEHD